MLKRSVSFNGLLLAIFALVTAGVVATTQQLTDDRIAESRQRAAQAALYEIVPAAAHDNDLLQDTRAIDQAFVNTLGLEKIGDSERTLHVARNAGTPFAAIVPSIAHDGYSGDIAMLVGINKDGSLAGVRVTRHNETPGLGDRIDAKKSNWILSLDRKTLATLADGKRPISDAAFDQLTGATITRKAVLKQVRRTLEYFEQAKPLQDKPKNEGDES